jgi:rubrerythrin
VTRRDALRLAALGAAAPLAVAGAPARADAVDERTKKLEKAAVAAAVAGEQATMVAFEAIANGALLDHAASAAMRVLLDHAKVHADTLGQALKDQLGQDPPLPPKRTQISGLLELRRREEALRLAMRLEQRAVAAHLAAVQKTHDAVILKDVAGILGSDGQHLVLLRQLLGQQPLPSAFERGT